MSAQPFTASDEARESLGNDIDKAFDASLVLRRALLQAFGEAHWQAHLLATDDLTNLRMALAALDTVEGHLNRIVERSMEEAR